MTLKIHVQFDIEDPDVVAYINDMLPTLVTWFGNVGIEQLTFTDANRTILCQGNPSRIERIEPVGARVEQSSVALPRPHIVFTDKTHPQTDSALTVLGRDRSGDQTPFYELTDILCRFVTYAADNSVMKQLALTPDVAPKPTTAQLIEQRAEHLRGLTPAQAIGPTPSDATAREAFWLSAIAAAASLLTGIEAFVHVETSARYASGLQQRTLVRLLRTACETGNTDTLRRTLHTRKLPFD